MRTSQYLLATLKETPADAELISQQLMLRAGMIRKLGSGLYIWLPLGLRVLRKVEAIVREEMNRAGAQELLMPAVQPAELWQKTGRWEKYGAELLKIYDRHDAEFCFGPTHEEVITELMRRELHSYKQLPCNFYQIQTKFRDEIRPRFGVMRAREFLMKDAYSFHLNRTSLQETYQTMYDAYCRIFNRLGLKFRAVLADTGSIGGFASHEFQVLANNGEDVIAYCEQSDYAANLEAAEALAPAEERPLAGAALQLTATPGKTSIEEVARFLNVPAYKLLKTLVVKNAEGQLTALVLRGDHSLNTVKVEKLLNTPLVWASEQEIKTAIGCLPGFIGPVHLTIPMIVDRSAAHVADFVCGANQDNYHYIHANWERDAAYTQVADLRNVVAGDPSPDGKGYLSIVRGIEVGHIFQLGQKYSEALDATVLDQQGKTVTLEMGCYGIGISRIVAAAIEQNHDEKGIIWPAAMAPFQIAIVPINYHKSQRVQLAAEALYKKLIEAGFEVLLDDRNERPGVMFADIELMGIPHRLVISERGLDSETLEYKGRGESESMNIDLKNVQEFLQGLK